MSMPTPSPANDKSNSDLSLAAAIQVLASAVANMNFAVACLQSTVNAKFARGPVAVSGESSPLPSLIESPVFIPHSALEPLLYFDHATQVVIGKNNGVAPTNNTAVPTDNSTAALAHGSVPSEDRWYAVIVGREPGIFHGSDSIMANTHRIKNASAIKCKTEDEAKSVFNRELDAGRMERVEYVDVKRTVINREMVAVGTYTVPHF